MIRSVSNAGGNILFIRSLFFIVYNNYCITAIILTIKLFFNCPKDKKKKNKINLGKAW